MRFSAAAIATLAGIASAASPVTYCAPEDNGVCYSFSVPQDSAASGQGDLFIQIRSPTSMSWAGVAQAPAGLMAGSNMFVAYGSQNGSSVTISPRLGTGHKSPQFNKNVQTVLLDGSGVQNGTMVANLRCLNCNSWQGGSMSLKDGSSTWIFGYAPKTPAPSGALKSNNASAPLSLHDGYGSFKVDLTKAASNLPSNINPFTGRDLTVTTADATTDIKHLDSAIKAHLAMVKIVHGVIYSVAWGLLFPLAAALMRLRCKPNTWAIHGWIQSFAYLMSLIGLGLGIYIGRAYENLDSAHAIIGFVITGLAFFMPALGWIQHLRFKKIRSRTAWGFIHAYLGRGLVLLGLINIGTGLQLAATFGGVPGYIGRIAYGVLGGIMGVFYLAVVVITAIRRRRRAAAPQPKKGDESVDGSTSSGTASDSDQPAMLEKEIESGEKNVSLTTQKAL